jgi:hypothetical protein
MMGMPFTKGKKTRRGPGLAHSAYLMSDLSGIGSLADNGYYNPHGLLEQ